MIGVTFSEIGRLFGKSAFRTVLLCINVIESILLWEIIDRACMIKLLSDHLKIQADSFNVVE